MAIIQYENIDRTWRKLQAEDRVYIEIGNEFTICYFFLTLSISILSLYRYKFL
ncbi:hypothetical protein Hanom_Chr16g01502801 [Helianthus anomalus]